MSERFFVEFIGDCPCTCIVHGRETLHWYLWDQFFNTNYDSAPANIREEHDARIQSLEDGLKEELNNQTIHWVESGEDYSCYVVLITDDDIKMGERRP